MTVQVARPAFPALFRRAARPAAAPPVTDESVEAYLAARDPEAARQWRREADSIESQRQSEIQCAQGVPEYLPAFAEGAGGGEYASKHHWAEELFEGCGLAEICHLVRPVLSYDLYTAFCLSLVEARTAEEIAGELGQHRNTITRWLGEVRITVFSQFPRLAADLRARGAEAASSETRESQLVEIARLMQPAAPTYRAPAVRDARRAYVCPCGHHLSDQDKSHHAGKRDAFRCRQCGTVWPRERWGELLA